MRTARTHQAWSKEDAVHFISFVTQNRMRWFEDERYCQIMIDELVFYADRYTIGLLAYVVMPDHVHVLIFSEGDKTFMDYMRGVKSYSAKLILELDDRRGQVTPPITETSKEVDPLQNKTYPIRRMSKQIQQFWQPEFFDYLIFKREALKEKLDYIIHNPVEDGLVEDPRDYKWLYVDENKIGEYLSW